MTFEQLKTFQVMRVASFFRNNMTAGKLTEISEITNFAPEWTTFSLLLRMR